jgi:hypothetical protein
MSNSTALDGHSTMMIGNMPGKKGIIVNVILGSSYWNIEK